MKDDDTSVTHSTTDSKEIVNHGSLSVQTINKNKIVSSVCAAQCRPCTLW